MARRKAASAELALAAAGFDGDDPSWRLARMLCALRHWADRQGITYAGADVTANRHYLADVATADQCRSDGLTYDGWERIHDDNKAEGRPIGAQWSKEGVDYSNGYKVRHR
jgi:hypothetical protein